MRPASASQPFHDVGSDGSPSAFDRAFAGDPEGRSNNCAELAIDIGGLRKPAAIAVKAQFRSDSRPEVAISHSQDRSRIQQVESGWFRFRKKVIVFRAFSRLPRTNFTTTNGLAARNRFGECRWVFLD